MTDKDKAWKDYKESLQDSSYMSRLKNTEREKDFKAGFEAGLEISNKNKKDEPKINQ